ncbi:hypothetical protein ACWGH2_42420 [Streptomyces sp. NPDC054871]
MAAEQQDAPAPKKAPVDAFTDPDPRQVAARIKAFSALTNRQFAHELAAFIAAEAQGDVDQVAAYAIRSRELARKARRLLPDIISDPDKYTDAPESESSNQYRARTKAFRLRAQHESQLLHYVAAGMVARRGHLPPEPNPRGRARRRLADEYPVRFLELVREEEQADADRVAEQKRLRAEQQAEAARAEERRRLQQAERDRKKHRADNTGA